MKINRITSFCNLFMERLSYKSKKLKNHLVGGIILMFHLL